MTVFNFAQPALALALGGGLMLSAPAVAQQPASAKPPAATQPAAKQAPAAKAAAKPAAAKPAAAKPAAAKPAAAKPAPAKQPQQTAAIGTQPTLLGQFGDWGAYTTAGNGGKVCYALAKPASAQTNPPGRPRDAAYMFVATRPTENVRNEVSVAVGYPLKSGSDASVEIGTAKFVMYTQGDGAWIKNAAEEARMIDAMRKGADLVVKGVSGKGTQSTDRYSLKGLGQALDRAGQECR